MCTKIFRTLPKNITFSRKFLSESRTKRKHRDTTRVAFEQNNSIIHYLILIRWLVMFPIPSRTTNSYRHYQDNRYTKQFLRTLPENITLCRKKSQCFQHKKHIPSFPNTIKRNISYVLDLTHVIGQYHFSVLPPQQTFTDITGKQLRKTYLTYIT